MTYWQAYKKVVSTNLKFVGAFAVIAAIVLAFSAQQKRQASPTTILLGGSLGTFILYKYCFEALMAREYTTKRWYLDVHRQERRSSVNTCSNVGIHVHIFIYFYINIALQYVLQKGQGSLMVANELPFSNIVFDVEKDNFSKLLSVGRQLLQLELAIHEAKGILAQALDQEVCQIVKTHFDLTK